MFKRRKQNKQIEQVELPSDLPDVEHEPRFKVKVIANSKISKNNFILSLDRPEKFLFIPGQYVWIVIPELTKQKGTIDRRAYSIYSSPENETIDFLIKISGSNYLSKLSKLKVGDQLEIIGPMGSAFAVQSRGAIMIAGGNGIAPFASILRSKIASKLTLFLFSSKENFAHDEEIIKELSKNNNYEIIHKATRPRLSSFKNIIDKKENRPVLFSGSSNFVDLATKSLLLKGLSQDNMSYEENYPKGKAYKKVDEMLDNLLDDYYSNDFNVLSEIGDLFFQISRQTSNHIILTDSNGRILFANEAASTLTGYTFEEMKGQTPRLWGGLMPDSYYKKMWSYLKNGVAVKNTLLNRRKNGELYVAIATITPIIRKGKVILFVATEEDITALRDIDKAKTEFVSFASHQLRAPLSIVGWYTEMLLSGDVGELKNEQKSYIKEIKLAGQRMVELIGSLLDASKLEIGTFVITPILTDIVKITQAAIKEQKNDITKKKINFSFSSLKNIPAITGDPKLLHLIVQNLLSNSIKYTPEKGDIKISLSMHDKKNILLKVSDTGYGIPKNQQDKIFTKLFRADNARKISSDGTGLGLYIIKIVQEKTGGKIWFESEENKGTTFYVLIPVKILMEK